MTERELPMLAAIGGILRWLEELITIASGPVLTAGLAIALVDLLTDGKLLASQSWLLYAWAVSQALGVDGQLVGAAVKCGRSFRASRYWVALACLPLIAALGYVAYLASNVFATQQALGISTAQALGQLGMNSTNWIVTRSALAVALVILSGLLRYDPPARASAADEKVKLERELELEPLRAALRARKAVGWRGTMDALRGEPTLATAPVVTQPEDDPEPDPVPPRGRPVDDPTQPDEDTQAGQTPYVAALQLMPSPNRTIRRARGSVPRETTRIDDLRIQAFALLDANPALSGVKLRDKLGCNRAIARDLHTEWRMGRRRLALVE